MRKYIYILFLLSSWIYYAHAQSLGGEIEQDPKDPKYQKMAEEVVRFHVHVKEEDTKKVTVNKVTTQVVEGTLTKIQFHVFLVNGKSSKCDSEIWDKPWENVKHVSFNCDSLFGTKKLKTIDNSQPERLRDPNNLKYRKLATLALQSYLKNQRSKPFKKNDVKSVSVVEAKVKLNSQIGNSLVLDVTTHNKGNFKCAGNVLETPWKSTNTAKVTDMKCYKDQGDKAEATFSLLHGKSGKNQKVGGEEVQDLKDPKYKQLAKESFAKYRKTHIGPLYAVKDFQMTKVTTQMVEGLSTTLDFNVITDQSYGFKCHSNILEQPWLQVKDITIKCDLLNDFKLSAFAMRPELDHGQDEQNNVKVGGEEEQDPKDPKYNQLAQESFDKYRSDIHGPLFTVKELRVTKVTTQVVSGLRSAIDFQVFTDASYTYDCHSDIVEQPWLKKKDIAVNCIPQNKIGTSGGKREQDPNDPEFKKLADESFQKYQHDGPVLSYKVKELLVTKVTTQVVSGIITELDFKVISTEDYILNCHSKILEQEWRKIKDITVTCVSPAESKKLLSDKKKKPGQGLQSKVIDEYFKNYGNDVRLRVEQKYFSSTKFFKTRYGSDFIYNKVDVLVSNLSGEYNIFNCSVVFAQPIMVTIGVNCHKQTRLMGRSEWIDPTDKQLVSLALKAFQKFSERSMPSPLYKNNKRDKYDVIVTYASMALVAGSLYELDFTVQYIELNNVPDLKCNATIYKDLKGKVNVKNVDCK